MNDEIDLSDFVELEDYPGYYISKDGVVVSTLQGKPKIIKPHKNYGGYDSIGLHKDGRAKTKTIHRLLAETYIDNPDNLPFVLHYDDDPSNNSLDNLRWGSPSDNMQDMVRNGHGAHEEVYCVETDTVYRSIAEAAKELDAPRANITSVCKGRYANVCGYHLCYERDRPTYKLPENENMQTKRNLPVYAKNLRTGEIRRFDNRAVACEELSIYKQDLSNNIKGRRCPIKDWQFCMTEEELERL